MCGICGASDGGLDRVGAMNAAMVHRGPDDDGVYLDVSSGMALGARRLSIIDVAGGHQPLCNEDGTVWAVLNGEIYNHPRLRQSLRAKGHQLKTASDTEVLVHLYEDYGPELATALEGMFAFAIWDTRRRRLVLGRDRLGEKPLFWIEDPEGGLAFASELTALKQGISTRLTLDAEAVERVLTLGYVIGPGTIYKEVRQLQAGHVLTWEPEEEGPKDRAYWELARATDVNPLAEEEAADEFLDLMRASVRSRLIADVPLGVLLSGGMDSSLIAALAAEAGHTPLRTFTVGYARGGAIDETADARAVARVLGTEHQEIVIDGADIAVRAPRVLAALDQPVADQALVAMEAVSELAARSVKVAVGGEGADELFGGYPRYRWFDRLEKLSRVPGAAPALTTAALAFGGEPLTRIRHVLEAGSPAMRLAGWVAPQRVLERDRMAGERLRGLDHATLIQAANGSGPAGWAESAMWWDVRYWLADDILAKADRASMLRSLEVRTPYLSQELAEFAASLPTRFHLRGKRVIGEALRRVAPRLRRRRKTAFQVPAAEWLRGPLRPVLAELPATRLVGDGWISGEWLRRSLERHAGGEDLSRPLWRVLALGLWLEANP